MFLAVAIVSEASNISRHDRNNFDEFDINYLLSLENQLIDGRGLDQAAFYFLSSFDSAYPIFIHARYETASDYEDTCMISNFISSKYLSIDRIFRKKIKIVHP